MDFLLSRLLKPYTTVPAIMLSCAVGGALISPAAGAQVGISLTREPNNICMKSRVVSSPGALCE